MGGWDRFVSLSDPHRASGWFASRSQKRAIGRNCFSANSSVYLWHFRDRWVLILFQVARGSLFLLPAFSSLISLGSPAPHGKFRSCCCVLPRYLLLPKWWWGITDLLLLV